MNRIFLLLLLIGGMHFSCTKGKNNPGACNGSSTRRDVKLLIDPAASEIDSIPIISTVDSLGSIDLPDVDGDTPRQELEKHLFTVTAKVDKVSKHRDGDYKVKLVDENEKYLNCEAPNIGCEYAIASSYLNRFETVRAFIEEYENELKGKTVTITGVAFMDITHPYPRNAAENEIELHPILAISF